MAISISTRTVFEPCFGSRELTAREQQVLDLVAEAQSNREIAGALGISEETVKRHVTNIFDKTGMSTRLELAVRRLTHRHRAEIAGLQLAAA